MAKKIADILNKFPELSEDIINLNPQPVLILDNDHKLLVANQAFYSLFNIGREGTIGQSVFKLNSGQCDIPALHELLEKIIPQRGTTQNYAVEHEFADCGRRHLILSARQVPLPPKTPEAIVIGIEDVTGANQVEYIKALNLSEQKFRQLYEGSSDALMTIAPPSWKFTAGNKAALRMFQVDNEKLFLTLTPMDLSPAYQPDGQLSEDKARAMIDQAMKSGSAYFEWQHRRVGGEIFPTNVLLTRLVVGDKAFIEATVRDISRTKKIENLYENIFNSSFVGIYRTTLDGRIEVANPAFAKMCGYASAEEMKSAISNLGKQLYVDYEDRVLLLAQLKKERATVSNIEFKWKRKDGSFFWVAVSCYLAGDKFGHPAYIEGNCIDITALKQAEEALMFKNAILSTQQEVSLDGILVVDQEGKAISYNHHFVEMWGIPDKVIATKFDEKFLAAVFDKLKNPKEFMARVQYLYDHKNEKSQEDVLLKDGRVFNRYSAGMFGSNNVYYGRVWFFRDVTAERKSEAQCRPRSKK